MSNKDIDDKILGILSGTYPKGLTYREICAQTGATKKTKSQVSKGLAAMLQNGALIKERKRYILSKPFQKQEPEAPAKEKQQQQQSSALIEGTFDATSLARDRSFAFVRATEHDYFIDSEDTLNAYHNDKVLLEAHKTSRRGESGVVRRILERANEMIPGSISKVQNRWIFVASNPKIHTWFEISDLGEAKPGQKVILTVTNWGNPLDNKMPVGKITEILGESGDPQVELLAVIREYQLPLEFPEDVIEEVSHLPQKPQKAEIAKRRDLRDIFTFTIDPASAKDFDDAISIQKLENGHRLWIHIADVAHYLPIGSAGFTEAAKRGNSFYFPKKVIPMIPERLSNLICSLRPGEDKLCMSVETDFDENGKVLKQRMYESVISSDARLAYEDVDNLYAGKKTELSPTLIEALQEGRKLSAKLTKIAKDQGYIFFDLPDIEYEYDEDGFVHRLSLAEETESHKLIENFMLVANKYVATELTKRAPFTIYRIHEDPDTQKLDRMATVLSFYGISYVEKENLNKSIQNLLYALPNKDYHRVFDRIILRSMKKAQYTTEHIRHFGLSLEDYTHFTSPIRRLCDLTVHHLCKRYITKTSQENFNEEQIKHWASVASEQELQADQSERDIERVYAATFMKDHIGEEFTALLVSTNSSSAFLRLNEMPVTAVLRKDQFGKGNWEYHDREMRFVNPRNNKSFELLDSLKVRIMEVSDDVYLELTDAPDAHTHYHRIKKPAAASQKSRKKGKRVDVRPTRKKGGKNPRKKNRKKR